MGSKKVLNFAFFAFLAPFFAFFAFPLAAAPDGNAILIGSATAQTGRPVEWSRNFPVSGPLSICEYPKPFLHGVAFPKWQANVKTRWPASTACPGGAVQQAHFWIYTTIGAGAQQEIDFRESSVSCEGGTCGVPMSQSAIQNHMGGAWGASIDAVARPVGSTTLRSVDARALIAAGNYTVRYAGPVATQIVVEDVSTNLASDFGWHDAGSAELLSTIQPTDTTLNIEAPHWANLGRPFTVTMEGEKISICHVDGPGKKMYVGTTNGSDPTCANVAGRGIGGTTAALHYWSGWGRPVFLTQSIYLTAAINAYTEQLPLSDASSIIAPTVLQVGNEKIRVCNKTGNLVTIGTGNWGCSYDANGRTYYGTNIVTDRNWAQYTPVRDWSNSSTIWTDAAAAYQKSLHLTFVITIFPDWAGVGIEYLVSNTWDRAQDQEYDITFYRGPMASRTQVVTKTHVRHVANSFYRIPDNPMSYTGREADRKIWDGALPAALTWDFNLPYLASTRIIPVDHTVRPSQTAVTGVNTTWEASTKCQVEVGSVVAANRDYFGPLARNFEGGGTRGEIGLFLDADLIALGAAGSGLTYSENWAKWVFGSAGCTSLIPAYFRERGTSGTFCAATESSSAPTTKTCTGANLTAAAFGRYLSIDNRPGLSYINAQGNATDMIQPVGWLSYNYINVGDSFSHWPATSYVAYVLSDDLYYERAIQGVGAFVLIQGPFPGWNPSHSPYIQAGTVFRKGSWGILVPFSASDRQVAWMTRGLFWAWYASADGTPEKEYFRHKLKMNAAVRQGQCGITKGALYVPGSGGDPDDYSPWRWGRRVVGFNDTRFPTMCSGTQAVAGYNTEPTYVDQTHVYTLQSWWMIYYLYVSEMLALDNGITEFQYVAEAHGEWFRNLILNPAVKNHFVVDLFRSPHIPCQGETTTFASGCAGQNLNSLETPGTEYLYSSWANFYDYGFTQAAKDRTGFDTDTFAGGGRARVAYGTAALQACLAEDGRAAFRWIRTNIKYGALWADNPQWLFAPCYWFQLSMQRTFLSATRAKIRIIRPEIPADCSYQVSTTPITDSRSVEDVPINDPTGLQEIELDLSAVPGTTNYVRATCAQAKAAISFTAPDSSLGSLALPPLTAFNVTSGNIANRQDLAVLLSQYVVPAGSPTAPGDTFAPSLTGSTVSTAPLLGAATYQANADRTISLQGGQFTRRSSASKYSDTAVWMYAQTTSGNAQLVQLPTLREDDTSAAATLPSTAPYGMYLVWAQNEDGYSKPVRINATESWWMGPTYGVAGGSASIYGRNLTYQNGEATSYVYLRAWNTSGSLTALTVTRATPHKVTFAIPSVSAGDYEVWIHNGHGGAYGWSGPHKLTVDASARYTWGGTTRNVTSYGAIANDAGDDTSAINAAISAASNGDIIYFPAGRYIVTTTIYTNKALSFEGVSRTASILEGSVTMTSQTAVFQLAGFPSRVKNLGFDSKTTDLYNNGGVVFFNGSNKAPSNNGAVVDNVAVTTPSGTTYTAIGADYLNDIQVTNTTITAAEGLYATRCFQVFFQGNTMRGNWPDNQYAGQGMVTLEASNEADVSGNDAASFNMSASPKQMLARLFIAQGHGHGSTGLHYVAENTGRNLGCTTYTCGEEILFETPGVYWVGTGTMSDSTTLNTAASFTANYYAALSRSVYSSYGSRKPALLFIQSGKGAGQWRRILSNTTTDVVIERAWDVAPDGTSTFAIITAGHQAAVWKNDLQGVLPSFAGTNIGVAAYGSVFDLSIIRNTISNIPRGIELSGLTYSSCAASGGPTTTDFCPVWGVLVAGNTISNVGAGIAAYTRRESPNGSLGEVLRQVVIRDNTITGVITGQGQGTSHEAGIVVSDANGEQSSTPWQVGTVLERNTITDAKNSIILGGLTAGIPIRRNSLINAGLYSDSNGFLFQNANVADSLLYGNIYRGLATSYAGSYQPGSALRLFNRNIAFGGGGTAQVTIYNTGTSAFTPAASSANGWLTYLALPGSLAADSMSTFTAKGSVSGLSTGSYSSTLTISGATKTSPQAAAATITAP